MTLKDARAELSREVFRSATDGDGWPTEADDSVNNACRKLVTAMADAHGGCWLGKINLYGDERHGGAPVLWKWDGSIVLNFSCAFVIPEYDAELERLIRERDDATYTGTAGDVPRVDAIFARIVVLGGHHLFWT